MQFRRIGSNLISLDTLRRCFRLRANVEIWLQGSEMKFVKAASVLIALLALSAGANAQSDYPNRQIQIFSGLAAGGGADIITRYFAAKLQEQSGQAVVVLPA